MKKHKMEIIDIVLILLSILLFLGPLLIFTPCSATEGGSWMTCHWAAIAVAVTGAALSVLSVLRCIFSDRLTKLGTDLAFIPFSIAATLLPGVLINLCGMKGMRCHTIMRPAVLICALLLLAVSIVDFILQMKKGKAKG